MRRVFSDFHEAIWRRLIVALLDEGRMAISVDEVVENLQTLFGRMAGGKPDEVATQLLAMPIALGPGFFLVDRQVLRQRIESRFRRTQVDILQDLSRIRGIVYAGYYGHFPWPDENGDPEDPAFPMPPNPVLDSMGFLPPKLRDRSAPADRPVVRNPARDLSPHVFVGAAAIPQDADVVVIGSGAGGAVAASNLVDQGYKVLIVEAGEHFPSTRISTWELGMASRLFKDGAIQTTRNNDIIVFQGRVVGGSTVINNGICLRVRKDGETHPAAEDVLDTWAELGAPVNRAALDVSYDRVEARLGIGPIERRLGRHNGTHMMRGWQAHLATSSDPMDRDAVAAWFNKNWGAIGSGHECVSSGYCNTGCPYGRKTAAPEGYLGHATRTGPTPARILCEAEALRIEWADEDERPRSATGVWVRLEDGQVVRVPAAKGVVVAAGTIASSTILRASGIANAGVAGVSLNIASPVVALMADERRSWDEDQMATFVDRGDFLLESHFQPPMSMATLVPGWFGDHMDRMVAYNRLASAGVLVPADRLGRVVNGKLSFQLGQREVAKFHEAIALLAKVHFAAGAAEVYPPLLTGDALSRVVPDVDAWLADRVREPDDIVLSSSHPHGGNAISEDDSVGVVNLDQRVHGVANVLVTDASVMPSCIRVNAQLTTMAMADRVTFGRRVFG